jgi:hypothetical protein
MKTVGRLLLQSHFDPYSYYGKVDDCINVLVVLICTYGFVGPDVARMLQWILFSLNQVRIRII